MRSNATHQLSRNPASPQPTDPERTALQAHQDATNALSMALHYLRANVSNVPGAARKAVQALAALNTLRALDAASTGARDLGKGGAA